VSEIRFTVPAIPIAQPRQRVTMIAGRPHNYTPTKHPVNQFKATCQMAAQGLADLSYCAPGVGLALEAVFVMPRPGGLPKRLGTGRLPHAKRPDGDNLLKSLTDALKGICWRDDAQLCDVRTMKWVAAADEVPHVEITIRRLDP
jgi:Holliday junction resolvase RusA-like endonuclease